MAATVSDEKLVVNIVGDPLYGLSCFSLAAFKILTLAFVSLMLMGLHVDLFEFVLLRIS